MKLLSNSTKINGVNIHYLDSMYKADNSLTPLIICPGLSEAAEEYEDLLAFLLPRRVIALSFRGRGQSESPPEGYDLDHHVADIEAVVEAAGVESFHLFGNSRGVSYALEYASKHTNRVESLLIEDYPSEHRAMAEEWPDDYINNYVIPFRRPITEGAVRGIQRESRQKQIYFQYERPVLVIRGLLEGSLIGDEDLRRYKTQFLNIQICEFAHSAHNIRGTEKVLLYETIHRFLK